MTQLVSLSLRWSKKNRKGHTWVSSERGDGLLGLSLRVQLPCLICLLDRSPATLESNLILSNYGLAIKDEKGGDPILIPEVKILSDMNLNACQAAESRKQRLMGRIGVQKETQIVGGVDSNGAVFELGNVVGAIV
jgi:hypothetical protein